MMKYDLYKDSDIDWLGDVPKHWSNHRVDWIGKLVRGNTGFKKDELLNSGKYVALQYGKTYKVDEVNSTFQFFVNSEFYKRSQIVKRGDTILISTSETIEDLGHSCFYNRDDLGLVGGEQILFKPNRKLVSGKYLYYYSKKFCDELQKYATGLKVFRYNIDDLKQIFIAIPSLPEQAAIAIYLDTKTTAIDKKITLLETKIDHYIKLTKSLINETVCKGLNKNVPLKDSGIEWIGEIPNHWQKKRLKDVGYLYSGLSGKTGEHFNQEVSDTSQHYIPFTNIANNKYINHEDLHTVLMDENERQNKVKTNDLFFLMSSEGFADIGKSALLIEDVKNTYLNSFCKGYRITKKTVVPKYLNYLLNSHTFRNKFIVQGKGFTRINLKMEKVSDFEFIIPPVEEQIAIAEYLDKKTTTIDAIVANIKLQIDKLKELRKALINDVVTGKLKVTE